MGHWERGYLNQTAEEVDCHSLRVILSSLKLSLSTVIFLKEKRS